MQRAGRRATEIEAYLNGDPALIGARMARSTDLKPGDAVTIQWRDVHGTFDAADATVVQVMRTTVPQIDNDQLWIPLDALRRITDMPDQATFVVLAPGTPAAGAAPGWTFRSVGYLLRDIRSLVRTKSIGASILYAFLLFLAMLAIFDTQVLAIFRRRREIGTLMALGMTRTRVIGLFTLEGALHGVLAALLAAASGLPLLGWPPATGYALPQAVDTFWFASGNRIFPVSTWWLGAGTPPLALCVSPRL